MNYLGSSQRQCSCCEECINFQSESLKRKSYHEGYQKFQAPSDWAYKNPPKGYQQSAKESAGYYRSSSHRPYSRDKTECVDPNTLKTLSSLRERACRFLGTSEGTRSHDEDDCVPYTRVKESRPPEGTKTKKARDIDYEPKSSFLKKMKERSDTKKGEPNACPRPMPCCCSGNSLPPAEDPYFDCLRSADDSAGRMIQPMKKQLVERKTQYSSTNQVCTCNDNWGTKSPEVECPTDENMVSSYIDLCRGLSDLEESWRNEGELVKDGKEVREVSPKVKSQHVSRSNTRRGRSGKRRSRTRGKSRQETELGFEPSLKKPHPNSCDRCWRFASPSRSPVNKPSQRFDPNYRRSHSEMRVNQDEQGKGALAQSSDYVLLEEKETKVYPLIPSGSKYSSPVRKTKSPQDSKRKDAGGASRETTTKTKSRSSERKKNPSRGENSKLIVNFTGPSLRKGELVSSSLSKSEKKTPPPGSCTRPSTHETEIPDRSEDKLAKSKGTDENEEFRLKAKSESFPENVLCARDKDVVRGTPSPKTACKRPQTTSALIRSQDSQKSKGPTDSTRVDHQRRPNKSRPSSRKSAYDENKYNSSDRNPQDEKRVCPLHGSDNPPEEETIKKSHQYGICRFCQRIYSNRPSIDSAFFSGASVSPDVRKCLCEREESSKNGMRETKDDVNSPRKYCVFYMNKTKLNRDDDVEILIEELTQGKKSKGSVDESMKDKKIPDLKNDSMALRFQKGVSQRCQRPETNRLLYL